MSGLSNIAVPILEANNFNNWWFRIEIILKREQCNDVLETDFQSLASEAEKTAWMIKDAKAQSVIVQGLADKHLDIIKESKTAKAQRDALKGIFARSSSFTKLSTWRKLINLKTEPGEKLEDHFSRFEAILRELKEHGTTLDESDKVCHLFLSMPQKYNTVVTALETVDKLTMDFAKARLLDEELKLVSQDNKYDEETSFEISDKKACFKCGSFTHFIGQCPKRTRGRARGRSNYRGHREGYSNNSQQQQANEADERQNEAEIQLYAANLCSVKDKVYFVIDSGASNHFVTEKVGKYMSDIKTLPKDVTIQIANGENLKTNNKGTLKFQCQGQNVSIEALIVPNMQHNLLSASKMTEKGRKIIMEKNKMEIQGTDFLLNCEYKNGLFILVADKITENKNENSNMACDLWHRRLGHPSREVLTELGLPNSDKKCSICVEGKGTRLPFKESQRKSKQIGDLIHSDVCGPLNPVAYNGSRYFQTIIDDFSHFVTVRLLRTKDQASQNLMDYIQNLERQQNIKVKAVRVDNGGEYTTNDFKEYCRKKGIKLEYTIPYTPQENGTAERMNRTLLNKLRTKLIDSGVPKELWCEALQCSVYELNRLPTKSLPKGQTPAKIFLGKSEIDKIKIFGSCVWHTVLPKQNKLEKRAEKGVLVGYCGGGYRVWLPGERKVIRSRDVRIDESTMEYMKSSNNTIVNQTTENQPTYTTISFPKGSEQAEREEGNKRNEQVNRDSENDSTSSSSDEYEESSSDQNVTRSGRNIKLPQHLNDYEIYEAYCFLSKLELEPKTFNEASKIPDWQEAIDKELSSHEKLKTWQPAKLPDNQKAIDTRWVFKIKEDGTKKARLVAKGFQVPYNKSDDFIYAPVCRLSTIRMILSMSVQKNWNLYQIDVPTAFLNGTMDTEVYIKAPEGLKTQSKYMKLNRALYGLRNAPKCWNIKFNQVMEKLEFMRSEYDYCLYNKTDVYMVLFVDDALITGPKNQVQDLLSKLQKEFNIKKMTEVKTFLGMEIDRNDKGVKVTQNKMINKLLKEFSMEETRNIATPMEVNFQINEEEQIIENVPYRRLICSLMYLSLVSRPDICYSVGYLSRFLDRPTKRTWEAAKRILRYLNSTKDYGLQFKVGNMQEMIGICDADWAGDRKTRKSVSGFICFHAGNPIAWHSRKQACVAQSSMEAEYISAGIAAQELMNIKGILSEFKLCQPVLLKIDNLSAISLIQNFENSKRSKHIDIKYHFIKDLCLRGEIVLQYVPSNENVSDMFTKSLNKEKFLRCRLSILNK